MKLLFHKIIKNKKLVNFLFATSLFITTLLIYKLVYPNPRIWYQHYLYQARSFISLRVDIPDLPEYYQDKIVYKDKTLTPFPPVPAAVLVPFILLFKNVEQQQVSFILGALNMVLAFFLLKKYTDRRKSALISVFFGFGSVAFWASVVGTTWYFAHTVAIMFMLLSLIAHKAKRHFLSGLLFAFAALSRLPMLVGGIYFLLELYKQPRSLLRFLAGSFIFIPITLVYNFMRYGNIFTTGYVEVYKSYVSSNYPYTFRQLINPATKYFGYMDLRNIPLHLYTFLLMPPNVLKTFQISPSPYGMGILFTTPLLLISLIPNFKNNLQRNLFVGATAVALVDFLHYMQGWVQFGYRFLLDFLPFLLIILALRFKLEKKYMILLVVSIIANFWGVMWGIKLGW